MTGKRQGLERPFVYLSSAILGDSTKYHWSKPESNADGTADSDTPG